MAAMKEGGRPGLGSTRPLWAVALALAAVAIGAAPARANLIVQVQNSVAPAGGTGAFDVSLVNTGDESYNVAGFSVELFVPGGSGVTFTGVDTGTTLFPYIFGTLQSPPFSFDPFPNQQFVASDAAAADPFVTVGPGEAFGLAHVTYAVAPGTPLGPVTVSLLDVGGGTSLSDENGEAVPFTTEFGTITVTPSAPSAVPEPASLVLFGLGVVAVAGWSSLRKRPCVRP
jgi:hypothetical protein